jgi:hypothetical protein
MSDKLHVLYGDGAKTSYPEWKEEDVRMLRERFEVALREGHQIVLVALTTAPDGERFAQHSRIKRGPLASHFELIGALHMMMHDWQQEESDE